MPSTHAGPRRFYVWFTIIIAMTALDAINLGPSPLLPTIMEALEINMAQAGMIMSLIPLCVVVFSPMCSWVIEKTGAKMALFWSMLLLSGGALLTFFAESFPLVMAARVLCGVGYAWCCSVPYVLISMWFPPREIPFVNSVNSSLAYLGTFIAFSASLPLFYWSGRWQCGIAVFGAVVLAAAVLWLFLGRNRETAEDGGAEQGGAPAERGSLLRALRKKEVLLLCFAFFGGMLQFQTVMTYLPTYLQTQYGLGAAAASLITSISSGAGIAGGLLCGFLMGALGRRKPFTWPLHLCILAGLFGCIFLKPGPMLFACVGLVGFAGAGWIPALVTIPMELKGMTPAVLGAGISIIMATGQLGGFLGPVLGGWLAERSGLRVTLIVFALAELLPILLTMALPETGPKGQPKQI